MARIPFRLHPKCDRCGSRLRPLYYTPVDSPVKKRAPEMWYCPTDKRVLANGTYF